MSVNELTRDQLVLLKQRMITDENEENGQPTYLGELAAADSLVSDERVLEKYEGTQFVPEDFLA